MKKAKKNPKLPHEILFEFFDLKQKKDPNYSRKVFAKQLGVSVPYAGRLLSGARNIPLKRLDDISLALDIAGKNEIQSLLKEAIDHIKKISRDETTECPTSDVALRPPTHHQQPLDWCHFAILNLVTCTDFVDDPKWISKRLGITTEKSASSWNRLVQLNLVEKCNGRWLKQKNDERYVRNSPMIDSKEFYLQSLKKTIQSIRSNSEDQQDNFFNGTAIATNATNVEIARKTLRHRLSDITRKLTTGEATCVYHFSLQLTPLTVLDSKK